jgi:hypothetical protein
MGLNLPSLSEHLRIQNLTIACQLRLLRPAFRVLKGYLDQPESWDSESQTLEFSPIPLVPH